MGKLWHYLVTLSSVRNVVWKQSAAARQKTPSEPKRLTKPCINNPQVLNCQIDHTHTHTRCMVAYGSWENNYAITHMAMTKLISLADSQCTITLQNQKKIIDFIYRHVKPKTRWGHTKCSTCLTFLTVIFHFMINQTQITRSPWTIFKWNPTAKRDKVHCKNIGKN